jgi:hypothetical protein
MNSKDGTVLRGLRRVSELSLEQTCDRAGNVDVSSCPATKRESRSPMPERVAYEAARRVATGAGQKFSYSTFEQFLADVGRRPEGKFLSGRSTHALFRRSDGHFEWREKSKRQAEN